MEGEKQKRAGVFIGPEFGTVSRHDLGDFDDLTVRYTQLDRLADLSTTYLYRLIDMPMIMKGEVIGRGAYSDVVRVANNMVDKVPRNLASKSFASHDEFCASQYAAKSPLAPYIPRLVSYNPDTGVIRREYIEGKSGFELLGDKMFIVEPFGIDQIREIYEIVNEVYFKDGINFDIHPGNFKWDGGRRRWFLVDLGPMPAIGAEYFPRHSFEDYMKKIWFDLRQLMVDVPIRSLDIVAPSNSLPLDFFMSYIGAS